VIEPSAFEVELDIEKPKGHKSPGNDQISTELIKTGCRIIRYEIHKFICSFWDEEELPEECNVSTIVSIYRMGDKTDSSNYRGISFLSSTYKIFYNVLFSMLTPYAEEIIGDHQSGFRRNKSTNDHILCLLDRASS